MADRSSTGTQQVGIGTHVVLKMISTDGGDERLEFDIVPEQAADFEAGFLGANTPLAKALLGKFVGAVVVYAMGDIEKIRVVDVSPMTEPPPKDSVAQRQAAYDEALRKAERTNAEMFASSYGSKWGGYEMEGEE